jgi:hypothetical protein
VIFCGFASFNPQPQYASQDMTWSVFQKWIEDAVQYLELASIANPTTSAATCGGAFKGSESQCPCLGHTNVDCRFLISSDVNNANANEMKVCVLCSMFCVLLFPSCLK